jgi:hypothetical protein
MLPLWAVFGLLVAIITALNSLLQEKYKFNGFVIACWVKVICVIISAPFVLKFGLPENSLFYFIVCTQAILWTYSDVIKFNAIPVVGAGVVTRILPISIIFNFIFWFFIDHDLLKAYYNAPLQSFAVFLAISSASYFGFKLKDCSISLKAVKLLWPVLLAASIGPVFGKYALSLTNIAQAAFAFIFIEGLTMLFFWSLYYLIKKPVLLREFLTKKTIIIGTTIGIFQAISLLLFCFTLIYVENVAFASALKVLSGVFVMIVYRAFGRVDQSNVKAGLGIIASVIALILLKTF